MEKHKEALKLSAPIFIVLFLFVSSYLLFSNYKPKALTPLREVKGYRTSNTNISDIPQPEFAQDLAVDERTDSNQYTFKTQKSPAEVKQFYDNILLSDGWRIKKEGMIDDFYATDYRKDDYLVSLWAAYNKDTLLTFASVEISKVD